MAEAVIGRAGCASPGGQPGGIVLESVQTDAGLERLAPEWDELLAASPRPSPFLCWDWISTWWRHFGRNSSLRVITARSPRGHLLGLAPLHIVRRRRGGIPVRSLEFLGYRGSAVCADHLDFLSRSPDRELIIGALAAALLRNREWDVFVLADLAEDSLLPQVWQSLARELDLELVPAETCYFLPLPPETVALWQGLQLRHPEFVRNIHRYRRRLQRRYATRLRVETSAGEVAAALAALARLHGLSRARQQETSNFDLPEYRAFHEALMLRLAGSGKLYLAQLECEGRVVAVLYGFFQSGVLYYYQSGFDTSMSRDGVGKLLLASVLEDAIVRLGARGFDFLRGAESYKARWTSKAHYTSTLFGWRRGRLAARLDCWRWRVRRRLSAVRAWMGAEKPGQA